MNQSRPPSTTVDLLRHGEPVGGRRYRGQTDDPLSEKGWQQMRAAVANHPGWDVIYSSPLRRCAEFARELSEQRSVPLQIDARLMEIGFGIWEGRTPDELNQQDPDQISRFWRDPLGNRPAGAESLDSFRERVDAAWQDLLLAQPGKRVLVVGHAGITRMVMTLVLGGRLDHLFRIQVDNAGLTRIRVQGSGADSFPVLLSHGR